MHVSKSRTIWFVGRRILCTGILNACLREVIRLLLYDLLKIFHPAAAFQLGRCPSQEMARALCEVTAGMLEVRKWRHVGMVQIYTCCHPKDEPTCMTPHEFHACALDMLTTQRPYPTWLPIPSILVEEPGKVMYGDHAFSIQVRELEVADCLVSIATKVMHIIAASVDASNLAR